MTGGPENTIDNPGTIELLPGSLPKSGEIRRLGFRQGNKMKRKIMLVLFFILLGINSYAKEQDVNYLQLFFDGYQYKTAHYKFDYLNMEFSYILAENSSDIITKGIFYSYDENKIIIFLIIDDEKIYDNTNLLFQGIIATQEFYGYKVNVIEKNKCITTAFYTNKGKNVTDGPIFLWNTQKKSFSKYEVDRSQW